MIKLPTRLPTGELVADPFFALKVSENFLKGLYPQLKGEALGLATALLASAMLEKKQISQDYALEKFHDYLQQLAAIGKAPMIQNPALIPTSCICENIPKVRVFIEDFWDYTGKLADRQAAPSQQKFQSTGTCVVDKHGKGLATLSKPEAFRNSNFDEVFLVHVKHSGLPEGKKLKITIEEVD